MKRGGPLERRTPLKARQPLPGAPGPSRAPLRAQGKGLSRETRLAQRSAKTKDVYAREGGRRDVVAATLKANPVCQARVVCNGAPSVDVDEVKARSAGGSILDPANLQALCRACHDWKHAHPAEARALGLTRLSWE